MTVFHATQAEGAWFARSLPEQMGNIGSEVYRAIKNKQAGDQEALRHALARLLELFDLTLDDPRWRSHPQRLRELCRAREVTCDFLIGDNVYHSHAASLQSYFDTFALMVRARRPSS